MFILFSTREPFLSSSKSVGIAKQVNIKRKWQSHYIFTAFEKIDFKEISKKSIELESK